MLAWCESTLSYVTCADVGVRAQTHYLCSPVAPARVLLRASHFAHIAIPFSLPSVWLGQRVHCPCFFNVVGRGKRCGLILASVCPMPPCRCQPPGGLFGVITPHASTYAPRTKHTHTLSVDQRNFDLPRTVCYYHVMKCTHDPRAGMCLCVYGCNGRSRAHAVDV